MSAIELSINADMIRFASRLSDKLLLVSAILAFIIAILGLVGESK